MCLNRGKLTIRLVVSDPTKYFGCVLGAQVNCDVKNERYIVNGSHESSKLQDLLDGFIKKYVLCGSCGNPETTLLVNSKKGTINATCKACGHLGSIASKDKLATYILKFPPDQVIAPGASITKKSKKKDVKDKNGRSGSPHNDSDELNDVTNGSNEEDDDDWCDNAVVEELTGGAKKLMVSDDLDKSVEERCQMFFDFVQKRLASMEKIDVTVQKDILAEAERLEIKDKGVLVLCEVLFKDSASVVKMIKLNRNLFFRVSTISLYQSFLLIFSLLVHSRRQKVSKVSDSWYRIDHQTVQSGTFVSSCCHLQASLRRGFA